MKNLIHYFCCVTIGLVLFSCGKDDPAPDTEKPVITVLAPTDVTKPLRATVSVKAEAKDNTGIKKVEVFVNGTMLISATSSPVEASWDTKTVTDGTHQIKIVAEDTEGNKEEVTLSVEVKNVLFTFKIGASYLNSLTTGWIFITDAAGVLISSQKMINGETITVETPEGFSNDKKYAFNRMEYYLDNFESGSYKDVQLNSYTGISSGSFILDSNFGTIRTEVGTHDLIVTGIPQDQYQFRGVISFDANAVGYVGPTTNGTPLRASLFKTPSKVIYWMTEGDQIPIKYEVPVAVAGESLEVDFADFDPFDSFVMPLPGAISSYFFLELVEKPGDYKNSINAFFYQPLTEPDQLTIFYPNLNPAEYITSLYQRTSSGTYYYTSASNQIPTAFKNLNAEVVSILSTPTSVSIGASGDYQFIYTNASDLTDTNGNVEVFDWNIYMDKDFKSNVSIPAIPENIKNLYPDVAAHAFAFDYVSVEKWAGVASYNDRVKLRFSGSSIYSVSKEQLSKARDFSSGGRLGGTSKLKQFNRGDLAKRELFKSKVRNNH